jgi:hypothetical protein
MIVPELGAIIDLYLCRSGPRNIFSLLLPTVCNPQDLNNFINLYVLCAILSRNKSTQQRQKIVFFHFTILDYGANLLILKQMFFILFSIPQMEIV